MTPISFVIILIALTAFTVGQLLLKRGMGSTVDAGFGQRTFFVYVVAGTGAMAVSFFLTLGLLQDYDLSYIDPFQGLAVVFITIAAVVWLREKITWPVAVGSFLIAVGLVLVSLS